MTWIIFILLAYVLIGALLIARQMRGLQVSASMREWATFVLLWPLMIRFFLQLTLLQARISQVEDWADPEHDNS